MFSFAALVIHTWVQCWHEVSVLMYVIIVFSVHHTEMWTSMKPHPTLTFRRCMDITKRHRTKSAFETVEACFSQTFLLRIGYFFSRLPFVRSSSCSVATITFVPFLWRVLKCLSGPQYIAKKLLDINERGTYVDPSTLRSDKPAEKAKLLAQEEELFQIARLINCGWFASGEGNDYVVAEWCLLISFSRVFGLLLVYLRSG